MPRLPLSEILPVTFITRINSNLPFINQSSQLQYFSIIYNTYFTSWLEYLIHPLASEALQTACKFRQGLGYWKCSALFMANLWSMFIFVARFPNILEVRISFILFFNWFKTQSGKRNLFFRLSQNPTSSAKLLCISISPPADWSCNNGNWIWVKESSINCWQKDVTAGPTPHGSIIITVW